MIFSLHQLTAERLPTLPWSRIAAAILPRGYELSLVFVSPAKARELNLTYRRQDRPTNILSFPLGPRTGEIIICHRLARREAAAQKIVLADYLIYLFIHGLLHLKGFRHGSKMERAEKKFLNQFTPHGQAARHRTRHRHLGDSSRRLRTRPGK